MLARVTGCFSVIINDSTKRFDIMRPFRFIILIFPTVVFCQPTKNTVFTELGGSAFLYSINYDRIFSLPYESQYLSARIGATYIPVPSENRKIYGGPFGISLLKQINKNFAEFGFSAALLVDQYDIHILYYNGSRGSPTRMKDLVIIPALRIGLRHQPEKAGIFWNALFQFNTVLITGLTQEKKLQENFSTPWFSFGAGYSF